MGLLDRIKHGWNAFIGYDPPNNKIYPYLSFANLGPSSGVRQDIVYSYKGNNKSIVGSIYNRIAIDVSLIPINHVKLDENRRFLEIIDSGLNECLTAEANIDQTGEELIRDAVSIMLDDGVVAVAPIDTTANPLNDNKYDVLSMRACRINQWYPQYVELEAYNEKTGKKVLIKLPKKDVAIIQNPFYDIMNESGSLCQKLIKKLALLDTVDEQSGSNKLDLIVQLPYTVKTQIRKDLANERLKNIEDQLKSSKYGVAYIDGTEKVTQLNRPVENNILKSVEYLTSMLFSQFGITQSILDGTADEKTMLNYMNRTIRPIIQAFVNEFKRKFLSKTARKNKQSIMYFNDPFKLVPISQIADIADKFTRNEVMSTNEMRQLIGLKPVQNPQADELRNKNLNPGEGQSYVNTNGQIVNSNNGQQPIMEKESTSRISGDTPISKLMTDVNEQGD